MTATTRKCIDSDTQVTTKAHNGHANCGNCGQVVKVYIGTNDITYLTTHRMA